MNTGVQTIIDSYVRTGEIQAPLQAAGAAVQSFAGQSTDALRSMAAHSKNAFDAFKGNLTDAVAATKDQLDQMKAALSAAKADLTRFSQTPIQGTKAFSDQTFGLQQQQYAIQLQMDQAKMAGASSSQLKPLQDQLDQLRLKAETVNLQEHLKMDPLKRQIQDLTNSKPELPFDQIVAGIKKAQSNIAILTPAVSSMQHVYDQQSKALQAMTTAVAGVGGAVKGLGSHLDTLASSLHKTGQAQAVQAVQTKTATESFNFASIAAAHAVQQKHAALAEDAAATTEWQNRVSGATDAVRTGFQAFGAAIAPLVDVVRTQMPTIQQIVTTVFHAVQQVIQDVLGAVKPFIELTLAQIHLWWLTNGQQIQEATQKVWTVLQQIITVALTLIRDDIQVNLAVTRAIWQVAWQVIQVVVSTVWDIIKTLVTLAITDLEDLIMIGVDLINGNWGDAWTRFQDIFSTTWTAVKSIARDGVDGVIRVLDVFIQAWDGLKLTIPGFSITIPSITVPEVGTVGGGSLSWGGFSEAVMQIPPIPMLAAGGIALGPTLALIGESGPEAVLPLSDLNNPGVGGISAPRGGSGTVVNNYFQITGNRIMKSGDVDDLAELLAQSFNRKMNLSLAH